MDAAGTAYLPPGCQIVPSSFAVTGVSIRHFPSAAAADNARRTASADGQKLVLLQGTMFPEPMMLMLLMDIPSSTGDQKVDTSTLSRVWMMRQPNEVASTPMGPKWLNAREDRGAELRHAQRNRQAFVAIEELRRDPHLEMHTRGG